MADRSGGLRPFYHERVAPGLACDSASSRVLYPDFPFYEPGINVADQATPFQLVGVCRISAVGRSLK